MDCTRRGLLAAGGLGAAAPSIFRAKTTDTYPLWEVRRGAARVYLFGDGGSVTDPWTSPRILAAFDRSAVFWKETPDGTPNREKAIAAGVDHARPLSTWLTPEQKDRVAAAAARAGITYAALEPLKPWLASVVLSNAYAQHRPPGQAQPGEAPGSDPISVLTGRAKAAGKPIRTEFDLESMITWPDTMPAAAQVQYLLYIIDSNAIAPERMAQRRRGWAAGDLGPETREALRVKQAYPDLYEPLAAERNRAWTPRIRKMLDDGGTTFVLVGCDHLLGPDSVLIQLAAAGLRAKRV
jgi:uncharacterized protein YbaP (TraB family)